MADYNKVMLIGNLTRDPEIRYTPKGTAIAELGLAINNSYKTQDGTTREEVTFVDVDVWGRQAETSKEYLSKGRPVFIEGRLKLDQWEDKEGNKKSRLRVVAERVQFLGSGGGGGGARGGSGGGGYERREQRGGSGGGERQGGGEERSEHGRGGSEGREQRHEPRGEAPPQRERESAPVDDDDIPF